MDRESRDLLDWLNAGGAAGIDPTEINAARRAYDALFAQLGGEPHPGVTPRAGDVAGPGGRIPVRVYQPATPAAAPVPAVLFLHGGGWSMGGFDAYDALASQMAGLSGCCVVSAFYRLAPEHPYPQGLEDAAAALEWVLGGGLAGFIAAPVGRVAVAGDSSGGTLAAVLGQRCRDRLAGQVLIYPVLTLEPDADLPSRQQLGGGEYFLGLQGIEWAIANYLPLRDMARDPDVSPLLRPDLTGCPPALIITAGYDPLKDEGALYARRLEAAGVAATLRCYEQTFHGFASFAGRLADGRDALARIGAWLREALGAGR